MNIIRIQSHTHTYIQFCCIPNKKKVIICYLYKYFTISSLFKFAVGCWYFFILACIQFIFCLDTQREYENDRAKKVRQFQCNQFQQN